MQHLDEGTIHTWLDGALDADEARQAEAHAAGCAECAGAVAEARGLIAASSMILSKLDYASGAPSAAMDGGQSRPRQAPARARRHWLQDARVRAAAAILILAGGVAGVSGVTGREDLAGVVDGAALESSLSSEPAPIPASESLGAAVEDATAAAVAQPGPAAPSPTVGPAPHLPRPQSASGARTMAAPQERTAGKLSSGAEMAAAGAASSGQGAGAASAPPAVSVATPAAREERAEVAPDVRRAVERVGAPPPPPPAAATGPLVGDVSGVLRGVQPARSRGQPTAAMGLASSAPATPSGLAPRCYALTLSPWSPATDPLPGAPPTRIVLTADTAATGLAKGQRLVRPMAGTSEGRYDAGWWTEVSPSTLVLTWATPRAGIVMRLVRSGAEVSGTARTFGSETGVERASNVTGQLVECDSAR